MTFFVAGSMATSAQVATWPPFSMPQAMPNPRVGVDLRVGPAELVGGGVEDCEQTGFGEVLAAEGERVHADRVGELVHEGLAREVVRGGGERAIRAGA